jgi:hypothetical protein
MNPRLVNGAMPYPTPMPSLGIFHYRLVTILDRAEACNQIE